MAAISCCSCSRTVHVLLRQGEGPLLRQGEGQKGRKRLGQQPSHVTSGSALYNKDLQAAMSAAKRYEVGPYTTKVIV
jgi:hypothetical protein